MNAKTSSAAAKKHPSNKVIEQAFDDAGLGYKYNEEAAYYQTTLVQDEDESPMFFVVENDSEVPEVVCFAYLSGDDLKMDHRAGLMEFAARANVRLGRGYFNVKDTDDGIRVSCIVSLDYEEATLNKTVVAQMIGYSSNQMFKYADAFRHVAAGMNPEAALKTVADGAADDKDAAAPLAADSARPRSEQAEVAGGRSCARCGSQNPASGKFCIECGGPLGNVCGRCNAENESGARFCIDCGNRLGA
jgi:hypothetical protein